ncbi:hypothetical protein V8E54_010908 [Elaphomyces granulatus]
MVESKEDLLKKVGDTPRVKKLTPKTRKKVPARDPEDPCEEEATDEEMVDHMILDSEVANDATEAHAKEKENPPDFHEEKDEMEAFVYYYQAEVKEMEETIAVLTKFCREMGGLVKTSIDKRNPNQVLSRILTEVKAFMKSSIVSNTTRGSYPPAQAADVSGQKLQPMNLTQKQTTPKTVPMHSPEAPQSSLPPKDTDAQPATTKSYAETEPPSQTNPDTSKKEADPDKQSVCEAARRLPFRAAHPLFIVKTVNSILPLGKGVESAAPVRSGIALTPKEGTTPDKIKTASQRPLETESFEKDEKWVVVKIHNLPTQMIALNEDNKLTSREISIEEDVFPETAKALSHCYVPIPRDLARNIPSAITHLPPWWSPPFSAVNPEMMNGRLLS